MLTILTFFFRAFGLTATSTEKRGFVAELAARSSSQPLPGRSNAVELVARPNTATVHPSE